MAIINEAVLTVRVELYNALGSTAVNTLAATSHDDAPTTEAGIKRLAAEVCEVKMMRAQLLRVMPTLFAEASAVDQQAWNEEGFNRDMRPSELEEELVRLHEEIADLLYQLKGNAPEVSQINVTAIGPLRDPMPRPGESIIPGAPRLYDDDPPQGIVATA